MTQVQTQINPPVFEEIRDIYIPDLWGLARWLKDTPGHRLDRATGASPTDATYAAMGDDVLKCWHLCHSLRAHILRQDTKQAGQETLSE